jgi:long-chain-fatty-acid--[acyl-carrier-protein] ligase
MFYLLVTLPILILLWLVYTSRNLLLLCGRWILHRRYDVTVTGSREIDSKSTYLIIPNHPAIVDPLILVTELYKYRINIRPLVDESFFSNRMVRHILALFDAVKVPDFQKLNFRPILKVRPKKQDSARRARALGYTVLATLTSGGNILLYPSGHITESGKESIKNRQLAHNVISQLPENTRVLAVRIRGLYGSIWSRVGGRSAPPFLKTLIKSIMLWFFSRFRKRRKVRLYFEDITHKCKDWALQGRTIFNKKLEAWYDSDLKEMGYNSEEAS